MLKECTIDNNKLINIKVVYYNGFNNVKLSDKNFKPEDFELAYNHLDKWCYAFLCNGWKIETDERSPAKVSELTMNKKGGINIIFKGDKSDVNDKKACYLTMWYIDKN